ncbi:MAG: TonB-dependent receptor [Ignavibacteriales bacterium]|nr:TonB-dependent receptor [Ignavibacteriales bacterium]
MNDSIQKDRVIHNWKTLIISVCFLFLSITINAQEKGKISGVVTDQGTKQPLIGANVIVLNNLLGASTNNDGKFLIPDIAPGSYSIEFRFIGYQSIVQTDVIVKPDRVTFISAEMQESAIEVDGVTVTDSYFNKDETQPISAVSFNYEEIRRAPGSAGDLSRILNAVPGVNQQTDQFNNLLVRGGSPVENGFYLDNIPIPNINHFPVLGAAGGAIGILNNDFISGVNFYTGGFSSIYGDRLSSVMDISYRDGNKTSTDFQLDFNLAGFGGQAEGPIFGDKGSWMISAKRSYLDLIQDAIQTEGESPRFGDVQGKFTYDINNQNKITALFIYAPSSREDHKEDAEKKGWEYYTTNWEALQNTIGLNWRSLWSQNGYSNTSISFNQTTGDSEERFIQSDNIMTTNSYTERNITLRNINFLKLDKYHKIDFGVEIKSQLNDYDYYFAADTNNAGEFVPELKQNYSFNTSQISAFGNFIWQPLEKLTTVIGLRADQYNYNESFSLAPRISLSWKFSERLSVSASGGIFYQAVPQFLISQNPANSSLKNLKTSHYILGMEYMLTPDTKFSLEVYSKEYENFPMSSVYPYLFIMDQGTNYLGFRNLGLLESTGKSYSRGIDMLIQKKLAEDFYGLISASYFRSRYKDYNGIWRDRQFDNKFLFSVIGGYKPNDIWEFSVRWNYSYGTPYTPFDMEKSRELNTGIYNLNKINEERAPDYHSLNLRVDRRFNFQSSSIVAYISIWNIYNRKNVALYTWDYLKKDVRAVYQWSLLPIIGLEYEL